MVVIEIKVIKEITRKGLKPLKVGSIHKVAADYGRKWISAGLAEEIKPKSVVTSFSTPAFLKKKKEEDTLE